MAGGITKLAYATKGWRSGAAMLGACLLAACSQNPAPVPQAKAAPKIQAPAALRNGPTAQELTAGMVQAVSVGKSPLALDLKFELAEKPKIAQAFELNLALIPGAPGTDIGVQASGDGLTLAGSQFRLPDMEAGGVYRHTVNVTPTTDGVLLLNLTATVKHDELTDTKVFAIPVIVER